ncbi:MAG: zf-HC2 domain-containing protein [Peptoniphilaceae bacterium]
MNKISCDICLDLIPLVKDDIASGDSRDAVREHLKHCDTCKGLYDDIDNSKGEMDDNRVISKIKKRLYFISIATIFLGAILGLALTEGIGMFYNVLIMPSIGAIGYFALSKKSYYVPITLFGFVYIWLLIKFIGEGMLSHAPFISAILTPAYWALIYSGLSVIGIIIAFLLKIAFRKEKKNEEKN